MNHQAYELKFFLQVFISLLSITAPKEAIGRGDEKQQTRMEPSCLHGHL
jgi:hypothetical protein